MTLAVQSDVEARLGRDLTETETARVLGLLDEASDLVIGYLRQDPTVEDVVPEPVARVTSRMVARVFQSSEAAPNVEHLQTGPFQARFAPGSTSGAPWLSGADKAALHPYRRGGGMTSVGLAGERTP